MSIVALFVLFADRLVVDLAPSVGHTPVLCSSHVVQVICK